MSVSQRHSSFYETSCPLLSETFLSRGGCIADGSCKKGTMDCVPQGRVESAGEQYITEQHRHVTVAESDTANLAKIKQTSPTHLNQTSSGKAVSTSPAVRKLNSFKFVKTDRKRASIGRERNETAMDDRPPTKKPVSRESVAITHRRSNDVSDRISLDLATEVEHYGVERTSEALAPRWSSTSRNLTSTSTNEHPNIFTSANRTLIAANDNFTTARSNQATYSDIMTPLAPRPHTPLHTSHQTRITSEFPTPSQSNFSISTPLRSIHLTTPMYGLTTPMHSTSNAPSTRSEFLTARRSMTKVVSQLSSRLSNPMPTSLMASCPISVGPSVASTPQSKRLPSAATALICTPTNEPGFTGEVGILRTPVLLPRRKFPGPAGLLPPLVGQMFKVQWSHDRTLYIFMCIQVYAYTTRYNMWCT